jgi:hypothetical protein
MTLSLSTDEEHSQKRASLAHKTTADIKPIEEANNHQDSTRGGTNNGSNANRNNKYCYFCKQQGHRQEECRKRIKENKPCHDSQGQTYWPRIYLMDENQDAKSVNAINYPEEENLDNNNSFDIAGVNLKN